MDRNEITRITHGEILRMTATGEEELQPTVVRRPIPEDEIDRIGRLIVDRLLEAGVVESL